MKKLLAILLAAALLLSATACGKNEPAAPDPEAERSVVYASAEPEHLSDVIDLLYADITIKEQKDATAEELADLFHLDMDMVEDYSVRYTSGRYGLADAAIIKLKHPDDLAETQAVMTALEQRRTDRAAEFENYDIHDAHRTAKEGEIFARGNYIIFLMLSDLDAAHTVILENIPG